MDPSAGVVAAEQRVRQKRGQITYDALIETCFDLLQEKDFDEISIAELSQKAGYSVGAFYARFKSKDELFDAMIERHLEQATARPCLRSGCTARWGFGILPSQLT